MSSTSNSSDDAAVTFFAETMFSLAEEELKETNGATSRPYIPRKKVIRERKEAHDRLVKDYFAPDARHADKFHRRFRMHKHLFLRIVHDLSQHKKYFRLRRDASGKVGLSPLQKCVAAIRQLAYGITADAFDEYLHIGETTARQCLYKFCKYVRRIYSPRYLRKPTWSDIAKLYDFHQTKHGFPGMLASLDCMHWEWTMCPNSWRGQFMRGDHAHPTLLLEAVASQDLWFWHGFFGVAGCNNDINVLQQSHLLNDFVNDKAPDTSFEVNGSVYKYGYYLADGIYPEWSVFVKTLTTPTTEKRKKFAKAQEGARKDVERAFCLLKKKWKCIENPVCTWDIDRITDIIFTCMILQNMTREDEGFAICSYDPEDVHPVNDEEITDDDKNANVLALKDRETHNLLKADLIDHIDLVRDDVTYVEDDEELTSDYWDQGW